jgi:hypothetical protein
MLLSLLLYGRGLFNSIFWLFNHILHAMLFAAPSGLFEHLASTTSATATATGTIRDRLLDSDHDAGFYSRTAPAMGAM